MLALLDDPVADEDDEDKSAAEATLKEEEEELLPPPPPPPPPRTPSHPAEDGSTFLMTPRAAAADEGESLMPTTRVC